MDEFPLERVPKFPFYSLTLPKEKFFEIKDKLFIYEDLAALNLTCYSCGATDHVVKDCPKVHVSIPRTKYIEKYLTKRTKFMNDYIRFGTRSNKSVDRNARMIEAAKQIQIKVWEGELQMHKTMVRMTSTQAELPELVEHPTAVLLADQQRKVDKLVSSNQIEASHGAFAHSNTGGFAHSNTGGFAHSNTGGFAHSGTGGTMGGRLSHNLPSIDLESVAPIGFGGQGEFKSEHVRRKKRSTLVVNSKVMPSTKKEKKQNIIYDDIDRIRSFTFYFPHNNFEILYPPKEPRRKTGHFDYFEQSDTAKATLKKFITILREKVRIRREAEAAKAKEYGKRKSIFSKLLGGNNSPLRSRFYKESKAPSFGGESPKSAGTPGKKNMLGSKLHSPEKMSPMADYSSNRSRGSDRSQRKSSNSSNGSSSDNSSDGDSRNRSHDNSRNRSNGSKLK